MDAIGRKKWAVTGGHIPFGSTGDEPDFTSHDRLCVLNTSARDAEVEITLYYADRDPVGPYRVTVSAQRQRQIRFNDLIDPHAMPLDTDYAAVVESNVPVIVHFFRQDTRQEANAILGVMAFPVD